MLKGMCYLRNNVQHPQLDRIWESSGFPQSRYSIKELKGKIIGHCLQWKGKPGIKVNAAFSAMQTECNWMPMDSNKVIPLGKKTLPGLLLLRELRSKHHKIFPTPFSAAASASERVRLAVVRRKIFFPWHKQSVQKGHNHPLLPDSPWHKGICLPPPCLRLPAKWMLVYFGEGSVWQ